MVDAGPRTDEQAIWKALSSIADPEIPVISLVEMNVIRSVAVSGNAVTVVISPTFVGCPALEHIKDEIRSTLTGLGCTAVTVETTFVPPWSTDMLDDTVKEKLRKFGIAPPPRNEGEFVAILQLPVACPFCTSTRTRLDSEFGSTLCKQIFLCESCHQPFERFKPI